MSQKPNAISFVSVPRGSTIGCRRVPFDSKLTSRIKVDRSSIALKVDINTKECHPIEPVCLRFCKGISSTKSRRSEITYNSPDVTTGGSTVSCWEVIQHQLVVTAYDYARDTCPTGTSTQVILNSDLFLFSQKYRKIIISFQSFMAEFR
jgi:hypothetical protein